MPSIETVTKVTIKDEDKRDAETFEDVDLEFSEKGKDSLFYLVLPRTNETILSAYLDQCEYVESSSVPGRCECFRVTSKRKTVVIWYRDARAGDVLDRMSRLCQPERRRSSERRRSPNRSRSRSRSRTRTPSPSKQRPRSRSRSRSRSGSRSSTRSTRVNRDFTQQINQLIQALNNQDQGRAKRIAEDLADGHAQVNFALDITNQTAAQSDQQAAPPVQKPFELKLAVESFLVNECNDQKYDISILPGTKIADLKQMVEQQTTIDAGRQFWYIDRDNLPDTYEFGTSTPRLNNNTVLTLFITKPKN